jgi:acyl-CoA hydrolase
MTWIVMPGQCNALGTVFGGQVMAWIDVCAAVSAQRFCRGEVVTASMDQLVFRAPVRLGGVILLQSAVNWAGRTSMEVGVRAEVEDLATGRRSHTATAYLTFVRVDAGGVPVEVPRLCPETPDELRRHAAAEQRRAQRLAARQGPA